MNHSSHVRSPAVLISLLALFVSLGGTAAAGFVVTSHDIANGTILNEDIHRGTIESQKIAPNTITGAQIVEASLGRVPHAGSALRARTAVWATHATTAHAARSVTVGGVDQDAIQDDAVSSDAIQDRAVTGPKIADGSVQAGELGTVTQVGTRDVPIPPKGNKFTHVMCPRGTRVLSGGGGGSSFLVYGVESFRSGNGWLWAAHNASARKQTFFATALCLDAATGPPASAHGAVRSGAPPVPPRPPVG
ncbi:MAG TPA: hypothetical protein VID47_16955 [Actinomycetota bacterium]